MEISLDAGSGRKNARQILTKLVSMVARAYYKSHYVVILDLLISAPVWVDEDLAKFLHIHTRDLHKLCGKLRFDGLIKSRTHSAKSGVRSDGLGKVSDSRFSRRLQKTSYYIEYKDFIDVVKWRIYKIGKLIESEVQMAVNVPYRCPSCQKQFSSLEFSTLEKTENMLPLCDVCKVEIEMEPVVLDYMMVNEKYAKFMGEVQPIVDLLKETDELTPADWSRAISGFKETAKSEEQENQGASNSTSNEIILDFSKPPTRSVEPPKLTSDNVWSEARNLPGISAYYEILRKSQESNAKSSMDPKGSNVKVELTANDKSKNSDADNSDEDDDFEEI